ANCPRECKPGFLAELAFPAAFGLFGQHVKPLGNKRRSGFGLLSVAKNIGIEYAEDRGLLDDLTAVATVQPGEDIPNSTGFLDKRLQIATGAFFAGSKPQHGLLDPGGDQVVLQRALVLEILL